MGHRERPEGLLKPRRTGAQPLKFMLDFRAPAWIGNRLLKVGKEVAAQTPVQRLRLYVQGGPPFQNIVGLVQLTGSNQSHGDEADCAREL